MFLQLKNYGKKTNKHLFEGGIAVSRMTMRCKWAPWIYLKKSDLLNIFMEELLMLFRQKHRNKAISKM